MTPQSQQPLTMIQYFYQTILICITYNDYVVASLLPDPKYMSLSPTQALSEIVIVVSVVSIYRSSST